MGVRGNVINETSSSTTTRWPELLTIVTFSNSRVAAECIVDLSRITCIYAVYLKTTVKYYYVLFSKIKGFYEIPHEYSG
jgi:hypothetical protein